MRDAIFVSCAHADRAWLIELQQVSTKVPGEVRTAVRAAQNRRRYDVFVSSERTLPFARSE